MTVDVVRLGDSGLKVSQITLGCMSFGGGSGRHSWAIGEDESRVIIKQALDAGITTFDTANVYSTGRSEEITGKLLGELADRDDIVVATKVHGEMRPGPYGHGQSRKAILAEIDNSLRRLNMDHVDLYQIHRYDAEVPMEETMEALHDVVKAGKARYIGASSMWTWQFQALQNVAETNGWTPFISMQNHYNLLYREEEREMMPYCAATGVGVIPWSPLAGGRLVRDWGVRGTARSELNERESSPNDPGDKSIVEAVAKVANERGVPRAGIALAWMLRSRTCTRRSSAPPSPNSSPRHSPAWTSPSMKTRSRSWKPPTPTLDPGPPVGSAARRQPGPARGRNPAGSRQPANGSSSKSGTDGGALSDDSRHTRPRRRWPVSR